MESSVAREYIRVLQAEKEGMWHDASSVRMSDKGDCIAAKKELDVCVNVKMIASCKAGSESEYHAYLEEHRERKAFLKCRV